MRRECKNFVQLLTNLWNDNFRFSGGLFRPTSLNTDKNLENTRLFRFYIDVQLSRHFYGKFHKKSRKYP